MVPFRLLQGAAVSPLKRIANRLPSIAPSTFSKYGYYFGLVMIFSRVLAGGRRIIAFARRRRALST